MSDSLRMRRKNPQDTCLTGRGLQERKGRWALLHSARAMVLPLHTGAWCPPPPPATLRCLLPFTSAFSSGAALAEAQLAQRKGGLGWNQDLRPALSSRPRLLGAAAAFPPLTRGCSLLAPPHTPDPASLRALLALTAASPASVMD